MGNLKRNYHKEKGSITIFLSIIFFVMVSFILVLIDATRINVAKNQIVIASDNAAESAMANFNGTLFDEYGFFAYDETNSQNLAKKIFDLNMKSPDGKAGLLNLEGDITISNVNSLYNDNNEFKRQMIYAMKYQGTENLALSVIDKIRQFSSVAESASINNDVEDINDLMGEVQKDLAKIEEGKLNAQRLIIALTLCNYKPEFYLLDEYDRNTQFTPQIGTSNLLRMANENVGNVFFNYFNDDGKSKDFVENPIYQNIYVYKYAEHLVKCYKRTFEAEYEGEREIYEEELKEYKEELRKYNAWKTYEKDYSDWEKADSKWEEKKQDDENFNEEEPKKPEEPNFPKPSKKPELVKVPEILRINLDKVKSELDLFCNKLNEISEKKAKELVDKENEKVGFFIKKVEEGINILESFTNSDKRTELETKVNMLEEKLSSSSISEDEKEEIRSLIESYKNITKEENLNETKKMLVYIKEAGIDFRNNLYSSNDIIDKINSQIRSSSLKIETSKETVGPLVDKIFKGIYSYRTTKNGSYKESAEFDVNDENKVINFINTNFSINNKYKDISELESFRASMLGIHENCKIIDIFKKNELSWEKIDIGKKENPDDDMSKALKKLAGDEEIEIDGTLKQILAALDSEGIISEIFFKNSGESGDDNTEDFEKISDYNDYQYNQNLLDKIYLTEYIMTNFKDMADYQEGTTRIPEKTEHDSVLEYEIEAIVRTNGCYDDQKNKKAMVFWIKNIRTICNMTTILKTDKMKSFTERAAEIICEMLSAACSLIPYVGGAISKAINSKIFHKITQFGLIIAWARNEANLDTADLLRGYYVPIIKDEKKKDQWILDFGLNFSNNNEVNDEDIKNVNYNFKEPDEEEGKAFNSQPETQNDKLQMANYPDYLRIRLLAKLLINEDKVINAVKEISNANMVKITNDNFKYDNYFTGMKISVDSSVSTWFNTEAFGNDKEVKFNNYSYIKRYN